MLIVALKDKDTQVRGAAATALGQIGPAAEDAIPALVAALADDAEWHGSPNYPGIPVNVRWDASKALGRIGSVAVPALMTALEDREAKVRASAASALSAIGPGATAAVPALSAALRDNDRSVIYFY